MWQFWKWDLGAVWMQQTLCLTQLFAASHHSGLTTWSFWGTRFG